MRSGDRVSFIARRRARLLSEEARAALPRAAVLDDDGRPSRVVVEGGDPIRVLLFGSGPLIGYGVTTRWDAVDGHLARAVSEAARRGVTVESRVRLGLPVAEAVRSLGGAGTATFHVAVWAPRFGEELAHRRADRARADIRAMLRDYRAAATTPLVVCRLPTPLGADPRSALRRPRVHRFNAVLEEEADGVPGVVSAGTGEYTPATVATTLDTAWHRRLAEHLTPAVMDALRSSGRGPAPAFRP